MIRKLFLVLVLAFSAVAAAQADPLPSWNEGKTKKTLIDFVKAVTEQGGKDFVAPINRIAAFDNDGTLWAEQPVVQAQFIVDRIRALAPQHPEWKTKQPFAAVLAGDRDTVLASGEKGLAELMLATHTGMSTDDFDREVRGWLSYARDPRFKRAYTELVYQPMLELLTYLRDNDFKIYIVSGGTTDFMRPWVLKTYGVPPEQVIGTSFVTQYQQRGDRPVLMIEPKFELVDNGPGKPSGIQKFIGRKPIVAFGNSDGDQQMLQWTASAPGTTLAGLVHHTDGEREFAYDKQASIGKLDKALDEAKRRGWLVIDMKRDWKSIFPFDARPVR